MAKQTTYVLWEGPSELDGKPIMAVATNVGQSSSNTKTGDMIQVWYMRSDIEPHQALKTGDDVSVCGHCPLRPKLKEQRPGKRSCYVRVFQAPLSIYRSVKRKGLKPQLEQALDAIRQSNKDVRLGAYGDSASAPHHINQGILNAA